MNILKVEDSTGETVLVWLRLGARNSYSISRSGLTEVTASVSFVDGDAYMTRLPVFTEWWPA